MLVEKCGADRVFLRMQGERKPVSDELERACHGDVLARLCREKLESLGMKKLAQQVEVSWNPRLKTSAGRCWLEESWIELNPRLVGFGLDEVQRTLWHELAHLVAQQRHGKNIAPHGAAWRQACADLGIPNENARHDLPLPRRRQRRKFVYMCPKCQVQMTRVRQIRYDAACRVCCRAYAGGRFDRRFQLIEVKLD